MEEPQGAAALVGWAWRVYMANWRPVLALAAAAAAARWLLGIVTAQPVRLPSGLSWLTAATGVVGYAPAPWAALVAAAIAIWASATILNFFGGTADAPRTPAGAIAACAAIGLRRTWPLFVAGLVIGLAGAIGLLLLVVPGVYVLVRWAVAPVAVVVEGGGAVAALGRSAGLTAGQFWHVLGTVVLGALAATVASAIVAGAGAILLEAAGLGGTAGIALWNDLATAAATPWSLAMLVALYDDLRLRREVPAP